MPDRATRLQTLPPYIFAVIAQQIQELTAQGHHVIRLDIGNPDMPPPDHVISTLSKSADDSTKHGYSGYRGTTEFRIAVAEYYEERFGVTLYPNTEVLPLIGSKEGIVNLSYAYLDQGDCALVPSIGYPSYAMAARLAGAGINWVNMSADTDFVMDIDGISSEAAKGSKLLWVNYPNNPTGAICDQSFYDKAIALCAENDILLVSDNPYCDVTYGDYRATSALNTTNAKEHAIELMSLSKTFNMAGWRLGAAVGNADALKNLLHVKSNMDSGHFKPVYDAGIDALENTTSEWIKDRNATYEKRRDAILALLPYIGLSAHTPKASLYIWAKVQDMDSEVYVRSALNEAHVSMAPGSAYGPGGEGYIRISLGTPDDALAEALDRLQRWYKNK